MSKEKSPEKKIVVDEDWKARVEAERQQTAQTKAAEQADSQTAETALDDDYEAMPSPGLIYLASTMYFQALVCLGLLPHPVTGKPQLSIPRARHAIDTLEVLWEKTEGHRTLEESSALDSMLHELRLAFLSVGSVSDEPPKQAR